MAMSGDKKAEFYARRMHTPDDPARAEMRASLREISKLLIPLHRSLIDSAKLEYTENTGPIEGPGHLLRLVSEDPFFAWLRPMTSLIVDIDEMARVDFEPAEALAIGKRATARLWRE